MKSKLVKQELGYILFDEKGIPIGNTPNVLNNNTFSKLSLKNCEAIERGYDLDELAEEYRNKGDFSSLHYFKKGFQKAMELMGDKKFSEEDMLKAFEKGASFGTTKTGNTHYFDEAIQSLQQTEWDVEIVMQEDKDVLVNDVREFLENLGDKPLLDADGCLILKRM